MFLSYNNSLKNDLISFYKTCSLETNFLSFFYDEFQFVENDFMFLAFFDNKIVGIVTITLNKKRKNNHVGYTIQNLFIFNQK